MISKITKSDTGLRGRGEIRPETYEMGRIEKGKANEEENERALGSGGSGKHIE